MKIFVAIGEYRLDLRGCRSLKDKRQLMKSILDRLGNNRNMAACEAGDNDYWKSGIIAVSCVSSSFARARDAVGRVRGVIESTGVEVVEEKRAVLSPEDVVEWSS